MTPTRLAAWIAGIAAAILLAGCAGPRYASMASSLPALKPGDGRIVFYNPMQDAGAGPSGQPKIRVNKQVVGRSKPGSFFYVDRPAGSYIVTDKLWTDDGLSFMLNPGETRYVRFVAPSLGSTGIGNLHIELVDSQSEAQRELLPLRYFGASPSVQAQAQLAE
ncbi:hypothetical protein CAL26_04495 [Bordetella genomosp. 9]|uniref:DUF2846 domain-containing protein n=1 Tax=Bordetella genomosp. 9 TaxID=1416803 RepID=A0A261RP80_9BORD|nr:hypothetical protein [Bordetella genomosp. 9]OZI26587.1 hypothetical protein CAL26_04495 [Bordetella genomosp. 9]